MNKNITLFSTASALLLAMATAHAAPPTAELKVIGTLTVPTCTVAATDDGVYDMGKISATLVKPNANTALSTMSKTWTVNCDAETYLNLKPVDNRADSAVVANATSFGLGQVNESGKIGYYTVTMKNGTVDGAASNLFSSPSATIATANAVAVSSANRNGWSSGTVQKSGKTFVADLEVAPFLGSTISMNGAITEDANIDGSLTLNFAYGI